MRILAGWYTFVIACLVARPKEVIVVLMGAATIIGLVHLILMCKKREALVQSENQLWLRQK